MSSDTGGIQRTYGFRARTRAEVLSALEAALGVTFQQRESDYLGEYECYPPFPAAKDSVQASLQLRDNLDPLDDVPVREDFLDLTVLLEVCSPSQERAEVLQRLVCEKLGGVQLGST